MNNLGLECGAEIVHHSLGWKAGRPAVGQLVGEAMVNNLGLARSWLAWPDPDPS